MNTQKNCRKVNHPGDCRAGTGSTVLALADAEAAGGNKKYCSKTASLAAKACKSEIKDDYWIANANCLNITNSGDRAKCDADARDEQKEGKALCKDQQKTRKELCDLIGDKPA
jgi:hypothetical protein